MAATLSRVCVCVCVFDAGFGILIRRFHYTTTSERFVLLLVGLVLMHGTYPNNKPQTSSSPHHHLISSPFIIII